MAHDNNPDKEQQFLNLNSLRSFEGAPAEFWPTYLSAVVEMLDAAVGLIVARQGQGEWRQFAQMPVDQKGRYFTKIIAERLEELAGKCLAEGSALVTSDGGHIAAVRLNVGDDAETCLALVFLPFPLSAQAQERLKWL